MLTETDVRMLRIAYEEAKLGFDEGGCPIGSVLARGGALLLRGRREGPITCRSFDSLRRPRPASVVAGMSTDVVSPCSSRRWRRCRRSPR